MAIQTKKPKERLSITVDSELTKIVDDVVEETNTNRSIVISQCLRELARSRKEVMMIRYYEDMAREDDQFAKKSVQVIQKIASSWSD